MLFRATIISCLLTLPALVFGQSNGSAKEGASGSLGQNSPLYNLSKVEGAVTKASEPVSPVPPIIEMCDMGEIKFGPYSLPEADRAACEAANKFVALACNVTQYMPMAQQAMAGLTNNPGDPKKACESAEKLNQIALAMNAGFGTTCGVKAALCIKACNIKDTSYKTQIEAQAEEYRNQARAYYRQSQNSMGYTDCSINIGRAERKALAEYSALSEKVYEKRNNCQFLQSAAGTAIVGGLQSFAAMQQAKECQKFYAAADCKTMEDLRNKPSCKPVLCDCISGLYKGYAECSDYKCNMDCTKAENLDQIECICQANPADPLCANYNGGVPPNIVGGDNNNNGEGTVDAFGKGADGGFSDEQLKSLLAEDGMNEDFLKDKKNQGGLGANGQPMQPGAPLNAGGGYQGNPGAGGGRGGSGKGPYNTDILGGAPGANGAAFSGAGGGYFGSEGANQNPKNSINLRDFLPGGKGAQRALAGKMELEKNGVSDSNGLSNWQKITRQMNELRRRQQLLDKTP